MIKCSLNLRMFEGILGFTISLCLAWRHVESMKHWSLHSSTVADVSPEEVLVSSQVLPTSSLKATEG